MRDAKTVDGCFPQHPVTTARR